MNLQQLEYFLTSAQKGSLTRAAEELYTTQPHVSQVIKSLEHELGVALFDRTGSGIALTKEGERIRQYAENTLKNASLIREVCLESTENNLRIAANPSSRLAFLAGDYFLNHMSEELSLRYTECGTEKMLELIQNQNYDMGFLFVPDSRLAAFHHMIRRRHMEFVSLISSDLVVYSGPKSPFYGKKYLDPEELDGCDCIQMEDDFFSVEELLMTHCAFRSGRCRIHKMIRTNSDHLMLRMLKETNLCNIGSYWQKNNIEKSQFSISVIHGFRNQVSFGYLRAGGKPLRKEEEEFILMLKSTLE